MITPGIYDPPPIDKGMDYDITLTLQDANANGINIANYTIVSDLRDAPSANSGNEVVANGFTVTKTDSANGVFKLALTRAQTANITVAEAYYDVVITDDANAAYSYVKGKIDINETTTDIS